MIGAVWGAPLGGITGAIIGSGSKSIRWVEVPVEAISVKEKAAVLPAKPEGKKMQTTRQQNTMPPRRRWRFSATLGTTSSGPAYDIEEAMIRDGFDDTMPGGCFIFCSGPIEHPISHTGFGDLGFPWSMQLTYSLNRHLDCALLFSRAPIGKTSGYRTDPEIFLDLNYYTTTISLMLICKASNILRLGLGPAWFINKIEQESVDEIIYREQKGRLGAVLAASLIYPSSTRFFVKLNAQYRWCSKATYGPFMAGSGNAIRYLEPFKADFSHLFVDFGFGIRL